MMHLIEQRLHEFMSLQKPDVRVVIWGAGELGRTFLRILFKQYPQTAVQAIVDSSANDQDERYIGSVAIISPAKLSQLNMDVILVSSFRYQDEILSGLDNKLDGGSVAVFMPDGNINDLQHEIQSLRQQGDINGLLDLVYHHPEKSCVWEALVENCDVLNISREQLQETINSLQAQHERR